MTERVSNICYPRGSVVFAEFNPCDEYGFLANRPLIVISRQNPMFNTLVCISCGSRDRPGIEISLMNYHTGNWNGGHQYSVALPYSIFTINTSKIKAFLGVINDFTMKAIDKAVAFHCGMSDEVPPYMSQIYKDYLEPRYCLGTPENTQIKDAKPLPIRPFSKYTATIIGNDIANDPQVKVTLKENAAVVTPVKPKTPQRKGTAVLMVPDAEDNRIPFANGILSIEEGLTDEDRILVITRKLVAGRYGENKDVKVFGRQIPQIRRAVEEKYKFNELAFRTRMHDRLAGKSSNVKFMTEFEKVAMILYCSSDKLGITKQAYNQLATDMIKSYDLVFEDKRSWVGLENFDQLKEVYSSIKK